MSHQTRKKEETHFSLSFLILTVIVNCNMSTGLYHILKKMCRCKKFNKIEVGGRLLLDVATGVSRRPAYMKLTKHSFESKRLRFHKKKKSSGWVTWTVSSYCMYSFFTTVAYIFSQCICEYHYAFYVFHQNFLTTLYEFLTWYKKVNTIL
jgi:hypothetical protein